MNSRFYRRPSERLGQGDIFVDLPSLRVPLGTTEYLRRDPASGAARVLTVETSEGAAEPFRAAGEEGVAAIQVAHAILLTHGCELDKPTPSDVLVAVVRPLDTVPGDRRSAIRDGKVKRTLWLPENDDPYLPESYADFSRLTSVPPQRILAARRLMSPTPEFLSALYTAITIYFTRLEIDPALQEAAVDEAVRESDTPYL